MQTAKVKSVGMKVSKLGVLLIGTACLLFLSQATAQTSDQDKNKKDKGGYSDQPSGRQGPGGGYGRRQSEGGNPFGGPGKGNSGYHGNGNAYGKNGESSPQSRSSEAPGHEKQTASDRPAQTAPNTPTGNGDRTSQGQDPKQTGNPPGSGDTRSTQAGEHSAQQTPQPTLRTKQTGNGVEKVTASGQVRERIEKKPDGEHTQVIAPTGRVQREVVQKPDGSRQTIQYAANGKNVQRTTLVTKDGAKETTTIQYGHNGKERATETIKVDPHGREVSKTVVVKQNTVIVHNTTIVNNTTIVRNYDRGHYGFVYHPVYVVNSPVFVSWYSPYWYTPAGVWVPHPFVFHWGWDPYPWYHYHHHYWAVYPVYPTPAYWMTDWVIADYVAGRYAAEASAEQAREEARIAHEDADRARAEAARAREDAEIAEAHAAQKEAELRAARAEERVAKAEERERVAKSDKPNPNATPIDKETKEALRIQVEQSVAEKKEYAEQVAKGGKPLPPDLSKSLSDSKHVYPVSKPISVIAAADQSAAGNLTEGDLLKVEPGQEKVVKEADENTLLTMRVLTSKGEEGEVKAGTLISVSMKDLQDFDSEFRAKLDLGLAEAEKNKDQFKSGASLQAGS
jgi:hypothetical protein